ncbi:hypothetical protein IFM89_018878 [Coptis chinensis]|uniref:AIG1-type G domain-containing protein n=1 Tax=Coptis chinensis TaxID=261450 RepID=A0A835HFJ9_9MAGN|nr:hypothetical protein IFM89_018878 [Coptis chinensis]
MQEILKSCKNRVVLFDNKARDENKKDEQLKEVLSLINKVIAENGGKPYTDEFFEKLKAVIECILGLSSFVEGVVGSLNLKIPLFERK